VSEGKERGSGARTIAVLKLVAESGSSFTLSELANKADLPPSSMHRLLQPLLRGGLVERGQGSAYRPGRELFRLASMVLRQIDYNVAARPFLRELWEKWQETAIFCLYRPVEHSAQVVEMIETPHPLRHVIEPFTELSLLWGSLGRSILAHLPPDDVAAASTSSGKGPITGRRVLHTEELDAELERIRLCGLSSYRSEEADLAGLAAPVFGTGHHVVGSLGVTMPAQRSDRLDLDALGRDVRDAAARLGDALGHQQMVVG